MLLSENLKKNFRNFCFKCRNNIVLGDKKQGVSLGKEHVPKLFSQNKINNKTIPKRLEKNRRFIERNHRRQNYETSDDEISAVEISGNLPMLVEMRRSHQTSR